MAVINPKAAAQETENEDGFWEDGFPVDTDRDRLERVVAVCNVGIKERKSYVPETREHFANGPIHGIGLKVRRKRVGSTWDHTKYVTAQFGRFAGKVDGHWFVLIKDLFGGVYGFAEYTSAEELHKVWELD